MLYGFSLIEEYNAKNMIQNRLLQTIRLQQNQIQALQNRSDPSQQPDGVSTISETSPLFGASGSEHVIPHSPVPTVERNRRLSQISPAPVRSVPTGFQLSQHLPLEQESAILSSGRATPSLPTPTSSVSGAAKIEVAFYQAENQTLNRENQRLRSRIRELGKHINIFLWRMEDGYDVFFCEDGIC